MRKWLAFIVGTTIFALTIAQVAWYKYDAVEAYNPNNFYYQLEESIPADSLPQHCCTVI